MYLDYSKINSERKKQPMLRLRTLAGTELGPIPFVHDLSFKINYADVSEIEFTIPYMVDGKLNPMYGAVTGYKVVYTDTLGIYILTSPQKSGDGIGEEKTLRGYSLEQHFQTKKLYLEEGTYNFWNPANRTDTILERILELDPTWKIGYVAPRLIGCYRTFDEYDNDALSFCYGDAMEKYRCSFVFDVYTKTINVYDADDEAEILPIYLSYKNLVDTVGVDEISDEFATKLCVYGSDNLTIRDVNPTGTDYLVDLSYFIANGDLDVRIAGANYTLADKVKQWQTDIAAKQTYYIGLVSVRASLNAQKLSAQAALTDLNGEMDTLTAQQSIYIQAIAMEKKADGKAIQQANLDKVNAQIRVKRGEIATKENEITSLEMEIKDYAAQIKAVTDELGYNAYFTEEERKILNLYLIEGDITEETFVATDVDTSTSGAISSITGKVDVKQSKITRIDIPDCNKTMYTLNGGTLHIGEAALSAEVIRGTLEIKGSDSYTFTAYLGSTIYDKRSFPSGLLTLSGTLSQFSSDISAQTEGDLTEYKGSQFSFQTANANSYFTVNVNEYQKYSVALELYDFGKEALSDYAWPTYEFSISSGNFLYQKEFEPFKDKLELGKAVYLNLGSEGRIEAKIIGIELNFEDISKFDLVFSNRYQRKNKAFKWIDQINTISQVARSFDSSKYIYNRAADKTTQVDEFMKGQLNAAVNNIVNKKDQTVLINGAGIQVGGDSKYQLRIVDNMLAMSDDGWQTAKLAIGLFATEETGVNWGVNAELIAGKLLVGNALVIENINANGVMQFKVDSSGAWLNNATFLLQSEHGGKILIDPKYGLVAGDGTLYTTDGTTVYPDFINSDGDIIKDKDGFPRGANFFLDRRDGSAYFRGKVYATDGVFNGTIYATDGKFTGEIEATKGTFSGTIKAATLDGKLVGGSNGGMLEGIGLNVGDGAFVVDRSGNLTLKGNITWGKDTFPVQSQFSVDGSSNWHDTQTSSDKYRRDKLYNGTWGTPYQFKGTDGRPGSDASVTRRNIVRAMLDAEPEDGLYTYSVGGKQCLGINATAIKTGSLAGIDIYGGAYYDLSGKTKLVLNPEGSISGNADLCLYSKKNIAFRLYDQITGTLDWYSYGTYFLATGRYGTVPQGTWDFSYADVQGIHATFA